MIALAGAKARAAWLLVGAVTVSGCAGLHMRERANAAQRLAEDVRRSNGVACAPRELAIAEANAEFAQRELDKGDYFRAKEHVEIAEAAGRDARRLSLPEVCAVPTVVKPVAKAQPSDADGDGILDADDKCPREAEDKDGFEDDDGCPETDNDKDGIIDEKDKCPLEAEDNDKFEDDDGCPELDNDKDGVADAKDKCPLEAEDKDGFEDDDGCPEADNDKDGVPDTTDRCPNEAGPPGNNGCPQKFNLINVTKDKIEIKQTIFFETAKARIQPRSFPLLEEVAQAIKARPTMRLRIEGHTDSRGKRAKNILLSQQRADAVRGHLIGLGISPDRLEARGFGPDQPIETNKTAAGRDRNRRVEFVITQQ